MVIAMGIVVFWRIALRVLLAVIVVAAGAVLLTLLPGWHR
jgi:hypothetical protein